MFISRPWDTRNSPWNNPFIPRYCSRLVTMATSICCHSWRHLAEHWIPRNTWGWGVRTTRVTTRVIFPRARTRLPVPWPIVRDMFQLDPTGIKRYPGAMFRNRGSMWTTSRTLRPRKYFTPGVFTTSTRSSRGVSLDALTYWFKSLAYSCHL